MIFKVLEGLLSHLFGIFFETCPRDTKDTVKYELLAKTTAEMVSLFVPIFPWKPPTGSLDFHGCLLMIPGVAGASKHDQNGAETTKSRSNIFNLVAKATLFSGVRLRTVWA